MIQNLTKENFFNALREKCPLAVDYFCQWIDNYKKENNWDELFNGNIQQQYPLMPTESPKFHELPFEFQNGIIARFELETFNNKNGNGKEIADTICENYKSQVEKLFFDLQKNLESRGTKLN